MIVGEERLEHGTQGAEKALRRRDGCTRLRHGLEQRRDPLRLRNRLSACLRWPLPGHPPERRGEPLGRQAQRKNFRVAVPVGPEVGHQHETHIPTAETHGNAGHRSVTGPADHSRELGDLVLAELRAGNGNREGCPVRGLRVPAIPTRRRPDKARGRAGREAHRRRGHSESASCQVANAVRSANPSSTRRIGTSGSAGLEGYSLCVGWDSSGASIRDSRAEAVPLPARMATWPTVETDLITVTY